MSQPSPDPALHSKPLILRNLGGLTLENGGRPIVGAGAQLQRLAILSVIALSPRGVSRDRLRALFWPESDSEHARGALNQALYALRRDVGERELTIGTTQLQLNPDLLSSDVGEFERALDAGSLDSAMQLYRGPFLDGVHVEAAAEFDRWVEAQRERLAHRHLLALEQLAREAAGRGELGMAVGWWRRVADVDPLSGKATLGLVQALAKAGDRAGALQQAARHEAKLRAELDLPVDPALTAFVLTLRTAAPTPPAAERAESPPDRGSAQAPQAIDAPIGAAEIAGRPGARRSRILPIAAAAGLLVILGATALALARGDQDRYTIGHATQLTFEPGLEIDPALSPGGNTVLYTAGPLIRMRVYVRQRGGRAVMITPDTGQTMRRPLWSPDGTRVLYLQQGMAVVPALGGTPRILAPDWVHSAAWAPDGERVVYVHQDSLFVKAIENGEQHFLAHYRDIFALAWAPDGRHIAFAAGNSKFASPFTCCFGNTGPSQILVVPADSGRPVAVTDRSSLNVSPVWAPDSRRLLFVSNRDGPRDIYAVGLDASGRPAEPVVRLSVGLSPHSIALSADGRHLAYSVLQQRANIWALPITSGPPLSQSDAAPVTTGSQVVEWASVSPDGQRLYFDSNREGNSDLYRQALPGGTPVQLTRNPVDEYSPSESPDGRWIAYHAIHHGIRAVLVMPVEGGTPQRVSPDSLEALLTHWSPDGRSLAYSIQNANDRNGLYVVSRDSGGRWGRPRQVAPFANEPIWFPDGKTILVEWDPGVLWAVPAAGGPARIYYAPRAGMDEPSPEVAVWMPDGHSLVMKSLDENDVASFWLLPAEGGRPRLLARLEDPLRPSPRDELATDGKRLYFIINEQQSDIYVAELSTKR